MSEKKKLVPKRRFKEFENADPWEQRRLGDVSSIEGGGTPSTINDKYWNGDINWYSPVEIGSHIYISSSKKKITMEGLNNSSAKILPVGTVLFTSRAGIGNTAILASKGATNQGFQSIVPYKNQLNSYFIFSISVSLKKYGEAVGAGSTFTEVSGKQMEKMIINIPSYQEQKSIGLFFEYMDKLITLHQRKLEKLKNLKSAYLSEMFPAEGERKPKRRFAGFTDDWEQRKLEDIGNSMSGTSIESEFSSKGIFKVISIGSYSENSTYVDQKIRAKKSEKTLNRVLNSGDLTMILNDKTSSGRIIGRVLLIKRDGVFVYNQRTQRISPNREEFNSTFLYQLLNAKEIRKKIINESQGNTQIYVNWSRIKKIDYLFPNIKEQKELGEFFAKIDNLITLHQRKLEKLQNIKKAYLNEMFI